MTTTATLPREVSRMSFEKTLASLREAAGLTQVQLAARAGVPIDTYRRWEQGRNAPRIHDAYRLAKALGVPLSHLMVPEDMEELITRDEPAPKQPTKKGKGK
jgi:transcriptional regulator with XRE-family HTH domain